MPIRQNHSVKLLLPPFIHIPQSIPLPQDQLPSLLLSVISLLNLANLLDGRVQNQRIVDTMLGKVVLDVLLRNMVRGERPIGKFRVRE